MGDDIHGLKKRRNVGLESQKMDPPLQTGFLRNAMQFIAVNAIVLRKERFTYHCKVHTRQRAQGLKGHVLSFPPGQASENSEHETDWEAKFAA
jgi:hypothetical protein